MKPILSAVLAALAFPAVANAATMSFDQSLVVVLAQGTPDTAFSAANGNLPDGDRVAIDDDTADYGARGLSEGLLRFDDFVVPTLPITNATLEFFTKSSTDGPVRIDRLLVAFDTTTTYNSLGGDGLTPFVDFAPSSGPFATDLSDETSVALDVTAIVRDWAGGSPVLGFSLINFSDDGWDFQVVTDGAEFSPRLTVTTVPVPATGGLLLAAALLLGGAGRARAAP